MKTFLALAILAVLTGGCSLDATFRSDGLPSRETAQSVLENRALSFHLAVVGGTYRNKDAAAFARRYAPREGTVVEVEQMRVNEITGVATGPTPGTAWVYFNFDFQPMDTDASRDFFVSPYAPQFLIRWPEIGEFIPGDTRKRTYKGTALFHLYDDGWRVEKITS